jgi:peptide/nickel transport system substrate-binding protein
MKLEQMMTEVAKAKLGRREFIHLAVAAGMTASAAQILFAQAAKAQPKKGGKLRIALGHGSTTNTLDPANYLDNYMATFAWGTLSNGMTEVDRNGNVTPDLVESFEPTEQARKWVFRTRKGATFHNGKSVTPADLIASIRHHMGENSKSAAKSLFTQIEELKEDGDNAIFVLKAGSADFPYLLSDYRLPIMPAKDNGEADWESGIRTGPYILDRFEPGVTGTGKRNPNYYRDTWFDEVEIGSVPDPAARHAALLTGDVDYIDRVDLKTLDQLKAESGIEVDQVTGYGHNVYSMNVTAPPFDNPDVRNALKYAIDREEILKKVYQGIGAVGNDNPIAPSIKFAINPEPVHKYDPEMAKSLLKKAGLSDLKVELSTADAAFTGAVDAAVLFSERAAAAGIQLKVVREADDGYWDNVWLKKPFVASFWTGRPTVDWMLTFAYAADSNQNETFWKNPRFNELLVAARSELDEKKRAEMYAECQQLLHTDGGVINFLFEKYVSAHTTKVAHGELHSNLDVDGFKIAQRWWAAA